MGNITKKRTLGAATNNVYTYPTSGQAQPNAVSQVNGVINGVTNPTFSYDENGNLISGAGRTLSWTSFDKVASLTENSTTLDFTYDATQQRIKQSDGSNTILYLNDPVSGASAEYHTDNGGEWHDYLSADGKRVGIRKEVISPNDITVQFFVKDNQGSVMAVLNEDGTLSQKLSYDAWGLRRNIDGSEDVSNSINAEVSRGYTDHEHLPGSRIINMNGRMYDPELSRHLSADPYTPEPFSSQGYNRYAYVLNNPLRYIDPSGYDQCEPSDGCFEASPALKPFPSDGPYRGGQLDSKVVGGISDFCFGACFTVGWFGPGGGGGTTPDPDPTPPPGGGDPIAPPIQDVPTPVDPTPPWRIPAPPPGPPGEPVSPEPNPNPNSDNPVPPCISCIPEAPNVLFSETGGWKLIGNVIGEGRMGIFRAGPKVKIEGGDDRASLHLNNIPYQATFREISPDGQPVAGAYPIYNGVLSTAFSGVFATDRVLELYGSSLTKFDWYFKIVRSAKSCDNCGQPMIKVYEWHD